jgi:TonB family protein
MKLLKPALLLATLLFAMFSSLPHAWADDVADLNSDYQGKVLTLRHFYLGKRLVFQPDGALAGSAAVGPWTVDGQIFIETIEVRGRSLLIRGRRVCLVFDTKKAPPRDVLEWLKESKANNRYPDDRDKREGVFWAKGVDIEIRLDSENPDDEGVKAAMDKVFLASGESMGDIVPDFWRDYFDQPGGQPRRTGYSGPVYTVFKDEVSAPHQTYSPEPSYSEEARAAKYQGTMVLSVVIDPSGAVSDVAIATPLGLGLDEKAVEAVRSWKFEPAMKNGEPVAVKIMVEVDFHLY